SLADIENSSIAPALIESCPSRVFLPNDRAIEPQSRSIYERFGLNARQIDLIARAVPKRDYYYQSQRGNRLFELGLGPVGLALCGAGSPNDQKRIDTLLRDQATASGPGFAAAWFKAKGLGWAADLLPGFDLPDLAPEEQPDPNSFIAAHLDRLEWFNAQIKEITAMLASGPDEAPGNPPPDEPPPVPVIEPEHTPQSTQSITQPAKETPDAQ
ncbi:MAG: hypothetical protein KDK08_17200, partial [Rhizobiaceae bacterium]|nr:hypothetical protein [Rhizobiaceae bacterium]